jgi:hypothetical protein
MSSSARDTRSQSTGSRASAGRSPWCGTIRPRRVAEDEGVAYPLCLEAELVQIPVMPTADKECVVEAGLSSVDPVHQVVSIDEACVGAARVAAAAIAPSQSAPQGGRNGARLAPDVDGVAALVFEHRYHACVTEEPPSDFRGNRVAQLGLPDERVGGDVHHDLDRRAERHMLGRVGLHRPSVIGGRGRRGFIREVAITPSRARPGRRCRHATRRQSRLRERDGAVGQVASAGGDLESLQSALPRRDARGC